MDSLRYSGSSKRSILIPLIICTVVASLLLGLFGGAAGFVLLANNKSPIITRLRHRLGVDDNTGVSIPITQNVRLEESSLVVDAAKKVSPIVVSVISSQQVTDFFDKTSTQQVGEGTGFIVTNDGLIITNKHLVSAGDSYKVVLNDGRIFEAKIKAVDPLNDFAVLKIEVPDQLPTLELGDSTDLQIGQYVLAIGNALGSPNNPISLGVVSAKQRGLPAGARPSEGPTGLIQTDAVVNPANSGGPLVNLAGQIIGINTTPPNGTSDSSIGAGFAIPINTVKAALDNIRNTGDISRTYLGVRDQTVTKSLQQIDNLAVGYGALITSGDAAGAAIVAGSPAEKAGILENDIILEVDGEQINLDNPLPDLLQKYQVGNQITLKIMRQGQQKEIKVTLEKLTT